MDFSDDEIQRSVRKWLRIAEEQEELPIVLMPFDPEGQDEYEPNYSALLHMDHPTG